MSHVPKAQVRSTGNGLAAIRDDLKSDRVIEELERQILDGTLSPGDRLPAEAELCEILSVSRSVVRDAIRTLAARGLVSVRQGHGTTVTEPDDTVFAQAFLLRVARSDFTIGTILDARMALDVALVPILIENGLPEDWDAADEILETFAEAVEADDWPRARDAHLAFHMRLRQALHLPALELLLLPMREIIVASGSPPKITRVEDWELETHPPIVAALRAGDEVAARKAFEAHYTIAKTDRYDGFYELRLGDVLQSLPWARR